jgi:phosphoribosylformylglycinamidine synthase subunit PurL
VRTGRLVSAHDVSEGGLACALAESCIAGGLGVRVDLGPLLDPGPSPEHPGAEHGHEAALFGEGPGGVVVSGPAEAIEELAANSGFGGVVRLGEVGGEAVELAAGAATLRVEVDAARTAFESGVSDHFS